MAAQNNARSAWLPICFRWSFVILLFLTMVVPNSIKPVSVSFLALTAALGWPLTNFSPAFMRVVWMHAASSAVTLLYLVVGLVNGASNEALLQTLFIYIVSPALWILVAGGVLATFESDSLERMMENNAIFGAASVALFFYLFLNGGPEAVSFFIEPENANVNLVDGYSGATMHVYGTLLFMSSAMFAMLAVGEMGTKLLITLGILVVVAVTSGRSALMLSVPVGLVLGALLRPGIHGQRAGTIAWALGKQVGIAALAGIVFIILLSSFTEVDVLYIIGGFWEELSGGGGSERTNQANALFDGIISSFGIGAGHGIGVNYIRSEMYPWRYEIVLLATIYRVGFAGALVYAWPFIRYGWGVFETWKHKRLTNFDVFLFAGCASAFIAAATNPYIEAYTFHWMYVLPVTIFLVRHPGTSMFDARVRRRGSRVVRGPMPAPVMPGAMAARQGAAAGQRGMQQYPAGQRGMQQYPAGQRGVQQYPAGQRPVQQYPAGQRQMGQYPAGQRPAGQVYPAGQRPAGQRAAGQQAMGPRPVQGNPGRLRWGPCGRHRARHDPARQPCAGVPAALRGARAPGKVDRSGGRAVAR